MLSRDIVVLVIYRELTIFVEMMNVLFCNVIFSM